MPYDHLINKDAATTDTLALLIQTAREEANTPLIKKLAKELEPTDPLIPFLKRLFDYVERNVEYQLDSSYVNDKGETVYREDIWTTAKLIDEGIGDCKKISTFIAAVLIAAGIEPIFKWVTYPPPEQWTHIYIIVPLDANADHYITLDPTGDAPEFNSEVQYQEATLYFIDGTNMPKIELHKMGYTPTGVGAMAITKPLHEGATSLMHEMGGTHVTLHPEVKKLMDAGVPHNLAALHVLTKNGTPPPPNIQRLANVPLTQQRGAFMELIKNNYNGMASHLADALSKAPNALDNLWHTVGGDIAALKTAVINGATKKAATDADMEAMPTNGMPMSGMPMGKGFFKKILHAAAGVIHFVAPLVKIVSPAAGNALENIGEKAQQASDALPPKTVPGANTPPPPAPTHSEVPPDKTGIQSAPTHGSVAGSAVGFWFKTTMILNIHRAVFQDPHTLIILNTAIALGSLLYAGYKYYQRKKINLI